MKESLISHPEDLKNQFLNLKKICNEIQKFYNEASKLNFDKKEWKKKGKNIGNRVRAYEESINKIQKGLTEVNQFENAKIIDEIEDKLKDIKEKFEPMIEVIKEKLSEFDEDNKSIENEEKIGEDEFYEREIDLENDNELWEARRRESEQVKKALDLYKDIDKKNDESEKLEYVENEEEIDEDKLSDKKFYKNTTKKMDESKKVEYEENEENARRVCCDLQNKLCRIKIIGIIVYCFLLILVVLLVLKFTIKK